MEIVWKCFPALSPRSRRSPPSSGLGVRGRSSGRPEEPRSRWASPGGTGRGGCSPGLRWSITSSRGLSAVPTAPRAPPGTAQSEVDTLGCGEAATREKTGGGGSPGDPPVFGPLVLPRNPHLWLPRGGGRAPGLQDPPGSSRCRARQ